MKIEISSVDDNMNSDQFHIWDIENNKQLRKSRDTNRFQDDDINLLLGDKMYDQFHAGKYQFTIPKKQWDTTYF